MDKAEIKQSSFPDSEAQFAEMIVGVRQASSLQAGNHLKKGIHHFQQQASSNPLPAPLGHPEVRHQPLCGGCQVVANDSDASLQLARWKAVEEKMGGHEVRVQPMAPPVSDIHCPEVDSRQIDSLTGGKASRSRYHRGALVDVGDMKIGERLQQRNQEASWSFANQEGMPTAGAVRQKSCSSLLHN